MISMEPVWVSDELVEAIHERQIAEHGGGSGIRDRSMLESALARPRQKFAYEESADMSSLAAAYAFGIARNQPFVDGNKRTAYVVCRTFLVLNGWDLIGSLADRYPIFLSLAAGELTEVALTDWLQTNSRPQKVSEPADNY
jgi:death on curing protein